MANDRGPESRGKKSLMDRRSVLKLAGGTAAGIATGLSGIGTAAADSAETIDIDDGERIDPYLENISDGDAIRIPQGTYTFGGAEIDADNWSLDGQGCTFKPPGRRDLDLTGDNWSFGGVRFDTEGDRQVRLYPTGNDWRFHSCAWDGPNTNANYLVYPRVNEGHSAEIDRCWFGAGCGENRSESAIKGGKDWDGDVWIRRSYFRQNGSYSIQTMSPPPMRGTANFDRCYFENCYLSCLRTGNYYGKTCHVTDCVLVYDSREETPAMQGSGVKAYRGVWGFWGDVEVTDTDIKNPFGAAVATSSRHGDAHVTVKGGNVTGAIDTQVTVRDNVGSNPSTTPPEECVTSVDEAINHKKNIKSKPLAVATGTATGVEANTATLSGTITNLGSAASADVYVKYRATDERSWQLSDRTTLSDLESFSVDVDGLDTGTEYEYSAVAKSSDDGVVTGEPARITTDYANTIKIHGSGEAANYRFSVSGAVAAGDDIEKWDSVSANSADGWVTEKTHVDDYTFAGEMTGFEFIEGSAVIEINDEERTPEEARVWPDEPNEGPTASFTHTVDGLEVSVDATGSTDPDGTIEEYAWSFDGTEKTGAQQSHTFENGGDYQINLIVTDDAGATHATAETLSVTEPFDGNTLRIEGTGERANYRFTVSGDLSGEDLEKWDSISGSSADGWVTTESNVDRFQFTGDLEEFTFKEGTATVYLNNEEINPGEVGAAEHTLRVVGTGEPANYQFSVTGELIGEDLEKWDSVSGNTAEGWVTTESNVDRFQFTGDLEEFTFLKGTATAYLDGEEITTDNETTEEHTLEIQGTGQPANYRFTVSGDLSGEDLEKWDSVSGNSADGWVTQESHVDRFHFTGELSEFEFADGTATVYLDGEEMDL